MQGISSANGQQSWHPAEGTSACVSWQGKSTLMNWLLGSERSLTGPEPGLTRDAVTETMRYRDYKIRVTDTAGWLDHSRLKHSALG